MFDYIAELITVICTWHKARKKLTNTPTNILVVAADDYSVAFSFASVYLDYKIFMKEDAARMIQALNTWTQATKV